MRRIASIITALLATALTLGAQNSIKVNVQNLVALDEQFNVSFVIEGEGKVSSFEWEPGDDFQLVWGPQKGTSSSISIINGKRTQSSQTTYTYVLMPRRAGTFQLPAATATVKGEQISSGRVSVQVVSNGSQQGGTGQQAQGSQQGGGSGQSGTVQSGTVPSDDIFLRLSLSKTRAVVGETISATLKLYHRVNISGFEDARFPSFNGFWSQEVQAPTNIEFHRESIGDRIYNAAVLRSWTLIPQQAGEMIIDPAELVCLVNVRTQNNSSGSIFDSFFQDEYRTIRKRVTTPAIKVQVSKIPAGAPASFGGGVGNFRMTASLTRDSLRTHDAAALRISISGKGNISLLEAPKVSFPPDFEVYDIKTSESGGAKTFEYPFIPRSHGNFVIGPVEYSYYDVSSGKFVTLKSQEMPIKVARGEEVQASAQDGGQLIVNPNRKDVRDLGSDIRFISTGEPRLQKAGWFFVGSGAFWLIAALLVLLAAGVYFGTRKLWERRADVAGSKNRAATKMARKRLALAGDFLKKDLYTAFYEELHKALLGFVGDKLNMPAAELNKDTIAGRLVEGGASSEQAGRFVDLLDACEFARYAPSEGHEAMNAHFEGAVSVISDIDSAMKRKPRTGAAALAVLLMLLPFSGQAAEPSGALWEQGVNAYTESRWQDAADAWTAIAGQGLESAPLYYNIGNARYKLGDKAGAILWYERALKVDPSYDDARVNLDFVNAQIQDRIEEVPEFFLEAWGRKMCWTLPSNVWAVLCLVLFGGALACLLLFLLSRGGRRKLGFFLGLVLLLGSLLSLDFAFWQRTDALKHDGAVVMEAVTEVKSSPGSGVSLFVLHEGTKVRILETVGDWNNIELSDGRQGWIPASNITVI